LDPSRNIGGRVSGTDLFLSYARADRASARLFAEYLGEEGFSVWWDASLQAGETFDEVIEQRLRDAGAVIVLWSPRSVASRWVRAEATLADRKGKLVPAIIEACDRPIAFELTHTADLCEWTGDTSDIRWRRFVEDLRRMLDSRAGIEPAPVQTAARARPAVSEPPANGRGHAPQRQPLRPGSDEVILAGRAAAAPTSVEPLRRQPPREAPADEWTAEVHCLEVEAGELPEELFAVDSSGVKIGRTAPADIVLPHKSVSREHCVLGLANDELLVTDLNSTNGTYIDDARVTRAAILPVGSVLRVGEIALRHSIRSRSEAERLGAASGEGGLRPRRVAATP
jgi:hypothetical protein